MNDLNELIKIVWSNHDHLDAFNSTHTYKVKCSIWTTWEEKWGSKIVKRIKLYIFKYIVQGSKPRKITGKSDHFSNFFHGLPWQLRRGRHPGSESSWHTRWGRSIGNGRHRRLRSRRCCPGCCGCASASFLSFFRLKTCTSSLAGTKFLVFASFFFF